MSKRTKSKSKSKLGRWTLWADKQPKKPGHYWLAGYFPANKDWPTAVIQDLIIWEVDADIISGKHSIENVHDYERKNLVWCGPLIPPSLP